jgi:prevent-host-death family protein
MKKANLHEAKTNISKLVDLACKGEEVIICKAGVPIAKIIAFSPEKKKRNPGLLAGKIVIKKDFDKLPDDFLEYFI